MHIDILIRENDKHNLSITVEVVPAGQAAEVVLAGQAPTPWWHTHRSTLLVFYRPS